MDDNRRQTIVNEIEHWRRSKLLPDQYCDFLLNLYADPDEEAAERRPGHAIGKAAAAIQRATGKQWFLVSGTITLISFVVFYFSSFHPALQILLVAAATWGALRWGAKLRKRHEAAGMALTGVGLLTLLGGGLYLLEEHGLQQWGWRAAFVGLSACLWIVYGIWKRMPAVHLCGWLAALLVYGWLLHRYTDSPKWYEVQLYWIPLSILFGWNSWFVHRWSKPVSAVLFATCALTWFMPELYAAALLQQTAGLQLQLLAKIAVGGGLLFALRKQWMMWVA